MMRSTRLGLLGLFALLTGRAAPAAAQRDTLPLRPAFRLIDRYAERMMLNAGTPGMSLALVDKSGLITVRSYGYADIARKIRVTPATRFEIGSISKSFTAIALMQLRDEKKFDPSKPARSYLPWFTPSSRWRPVTGHDLLTHTAGLPADRDDIPSSRAQAYMARERSLGSAPGKRWAYSNIGFQVMGVLLEGLEHRAYPDIIRDRILTPLGMASTEAEFTNATRPHLAVGYLPLHDDRPSRPGDPLVEGSWIEYGSGDGAVVSNSTELGTYLTMLLNRGQGAHGRVLSEAGYTALMTPHALTERGGDHYGYGMFLGSLDSLPVFWHSGGMIGYTSYLIGIPSLGIGAVAFVNGPGEPDDVARFALEALTAAGRGDSLPDLPVTTLPWEVKDAAEYAGRFVSASGDSLVFAASGDSLLLVRGAQRDLLLRHGGDSFLGPAPEFALYPIRFGRGPEGVTEVWYGGDWYAGARYKGPRRFTVPKEWKAYTGHYRIMQPWEPSFRIVVRKGRLWWIGPGGNEEPLTPTGPASFRVGEAGSPETLRFDAVADGQALRATFSGMAYYRYFAP
jgi:CubicO group peptidase (beta-lactamase class C family)